jgi:hypothetical protein
MDFNKRVQELQKFKDDYLEEQRKDKTKEEINKGISDFFSSCEVKLK